MKKNVSIWLSQSDLVFDNGDTYDSSALLDALYEFCLANYPDHIIDIGISKFASEAYYSGKGLEASEKFFSKHGSDEGLFIIRA